jgi:hypothetical protein
VTVCIVDSVLVLGQSESPSGAPIRVLSMRRVDTQPKRPKKRLSDGRDEKQTRGSGVS